MRQVEIVIVGGGLAGSTAAAMLGRAGIDTALVDPHTVYPPDFRCEKLDEEQIAILDRTGIALPVLARGTPFGENWIARHGRLVDRRPSGQYGILYETMVNAIRGTIPPDVAFIPAKAAGMAAGADRQTLTLSTGEAISARLIVLANGLNSALRRNFGMEREDIAPNHSITIGFDVKPADRVEFDFRALTYFSESPALRLAYVTFFPIGSSTRINFFAYRDMTDPWLREMREAPIATMLAAMPGLRRLTGDMEAVGPVKIRPADLYVTTGHIKPGVVLVGDAYATSCPAAGTGSGKAFNDVERLCNHHIPRWLASPGMGVGKIAAFYADPAKADYDAWSLGRARAVRELATSTTLAWEAKRRLRFVAHLGVGALRRVRGLAGRKPPVAGGAAAGRSGA